MFTRFVRLQAGMVVSAIFTLLSLLLPHSALGQVQVMGFKSGTSFEFASGEASIPAFCLEADIHSAPTLGQSLPGTAGSVDVEYTDGTVKHDVAMSELCNEVSFTGTDGADFVRAEKKPTSKIKKVTFVSNAAAFEGGLPLGSMPPDDAQKLIDGSFRAFDPNASHDENQDRIWERRPSLIESARSGGGSLLRSWRFNAKNHMSVLFNDLNTQADLCTVRTSNGKYIFHDVGATAEQMNQAIDAIPQASDGMRHISVYITHPDRDHYRGLKQVLARQNVPGGVILDEIWIGASPAHADAPQQSTTFAPAFIELLTQIKTQFDPKHADGFARYVRKGVTPTDLELLSSETFRDLKRSDGVKFPVATGADLGGDTALTVLRAGCAEELLESTDARHAYNLVMVWERNGYGIMDFGDATPKQVQELYMTGTEALKLGQQELGKPVPKEMIPPGFEESLIPVGGLHADVIKWPHHAWFPDSTSETEIMKNLLKAYRPQCVLVSIGAKPNAAALARVEKIRGLVNEAIAEAGGRGKLNIEVRTTQQPYEVQALLGDSELWIHLLG